MKKSFSGLILSSLLITGISKAYAMTFSEGMNQSKPMALYLYANWADDAEAGKAAFNAMEEKYGQKYNFITLDIASEDAKAFNKIYHIYPNLPYVLLFKDGIKFSRYLKMDCVMDSSCFSTKLDVFSN